MSDSRAWRGALVAGALALELAVLAWPHETEHDGWIGRDASGEIAGDTVLAQSFHVVGSNLRALRFFARPVGVEAIGTVHLRLRDVRRDPPRLVDERDVAAAEMVAVQPFEYRFRPIPSSGRDYELTIAVPDASAGQGIAVDIMRRAYDDDSRTRSLSFAGRQRFGSLRFRADVDTTTLLSRLLVYLRSGQFTALKVSALVVAWVILHMLFVPVLVGARRLSAQARTR